MQAVKIAPEKILTLLLGKNPNITGLADGTYLLVADKNQGKHLPSQMAMAIAYISEAGSTLVSLVHPFALNNDEANGQVFEVDSSAIHREPYNWFGPQALVIEKKLQDFIKDYDGPRDSKGGVPRHYIPDEIAEPVILSDQYWQAYLPFVNDPDGDFAAQVQPIFKQ
ncbi:hypothetical protein [Eupransor demetentiae]|uniref:Uncharacterized protein n=1 Tax=Eupransor demetentiae TaxID=3109584 RepID=A0ABM9N3K6_9LACO|nr:hypothetical protein R54876_GBNLAHCA_00294 [Lactobacillaceae bacterium LMG 33000]